MGYYTISLKSRHLEPLSEIGSREITTWRGLKNKSKSDKYITDGTVFVDRKHVENENLFSNLINRKSGDTVSKKTIKQKINSLKKENQSPAEIVGQATGSKIGMGSVKAKWIAIIKSENGSFVADASAVDIVQQLLGGSGTLKVGLQTNVVSWWKYGVPVGGVSTWNYFDVELNH